MPSPSTIPLKVAPQANTSGTLKSSLVKIKTEEQTEVQKLLKRVVDVVLSLILLFILAPTLFLFVAIVTAFDSRGGIIFKQSRTGWRSKTFTCYKFRTMRPVSPLQHLSNEQRITKWGMFLRKTHIDELPQLVNVLLGEMSLVGPRPHMLSDTVKFESLVDTYHLRHQVRPGITGLAQVEGFFGTVESADHLASRVRCDIEYAHTWSVKKDLLIMLQTLTLLSKAN